MQVALMVRCADAMVNGTKGPFDIAAADVNPHFECFTLPGECKTLEAAQAKIRDCFSAITRPTIALFTPSYAKFPGYDGFIVYSTPASALQIFGYQVKLNRAYPKQEAPDWISSSFLLRGSSPVDSIAGIGHAQRGWKYLTQAEIINMLGYSFAVLCPDQWPEAPHSDHFDENM